MLSDGARNQPAGTLNKRLSLILAPGGTHDAGSRGLSITTPGPTRMELRAGPAHHMAGFVSDLAAVLATQHPSGANAKNECEAGEPDVAEEVGERRGEDHRLPFLSRR